MLSPDVSRLDMDLDGPVEIARRYRQVRDLSRQLCDTLTAEDCCIQSMPDASPIRWHLAHTTWFFETFVLAERPGYQCYDPQFASLFNSYYNAVGDPFPRAQRGLLSRPTVAEVWQYREHVDDAVISRLHDVRSDEWTSVEAVVELGIQHEQQHQELMLTDIKHAFSLNPLAPPYRETGFARQHPQPEELRWWECTGGIVKIGHDGTDFAYDNEQPRHRVFLEPFALADRLITVGEYLEFVQDGGYQRPELWLSEGWAAVQHHGWSAPLHWRRVDGQWMEFTLAGMQPLDLARPVCHVSYFEADALARWRGARLPSEAEWEVAADASADRCSSRGFVDRLLPRGAAIHPTVAPECSGGCRSSVEPVHIEPRQMLGDVWEWTSSAYAPYPGYRPPDGALGEYNGKFMCNQYVLRGGSCASSSDHLRVTYRNFFPTAARWQFSGIRLARSTIA